MGLTEIDQYGPTFIINNSPVWPTPKVLPGKKNFEGQNIEY